MKKILNSLFNLNKNNKKVIINYIDKIAISKHMINSPLFQ